MARAITAAGLRCEVAAPSKLLRPAGDPVTTDARDAVMLARLSRLDEIVAVRVPTITQEAARDLVRVREDVRGDLMRARHRVWSNPLLDCEQTPTVVTLDLRAARRLQPKHRPAVPNPRRSD